MIRSAACNPFRISRVEALPWINAGQSLDEIYSNWQVHDFRGQVAGSHGAGKTTLCTRMTDLAREQGLEVLHLFANTESLARDFVVWEQKLATANQDTVIFMDGVGHAPWLKRRRWLSRYRRVLCPVHRPLCGVPVLAQLCVDVSLLSCLTFELAGEEGLALLNRMGGAELLLARSDGNVREVWRALYGAWADELGA